MEAHRCIDTAFNKIMSVIGNRDKPGEHEPSIK